LTFSSRKTRAAAPNNIAPFAQYIPLMGTVEDRIVECFEKGGGVHYSEFGRFHEVMAEDSGQTVVAALDDHILPLVPGLTDELERGIDVLDVGCGAGRAVNLMAKHFPASRFLGYDFSKEAIQVAQDQADRDELPNARFEVRDAVDLGLTEEFDLITTFDAVHDQARPDMVLAQIHKALKNDGVYLMQDIAGSSHVHKNLDHPVGPFLYTISTMHCMTVSLAMDGMGLGTMWGEEKAREMLAEAGFKGVEVKNLAHDFQNSYFVCRKQ
jgi:2-polyprenyl-3-methyl-5-hydroxy-6-metoxy-1,4-benzoquinol methylase